jgi:hypothetical protein
MQEFALFAVLLKERPYKNPYIAAVGERVLTDAVHEPSRNGFLARGTANGSEKGSHGPSSPLPWSA